jgi:two-component SAPR family response regulator
MNEKKTISQIKTYESNFKTILMNELRRTLTQMSRTLFCDDYETFCDDERYEYQEMKRSLLKKLCTAPFRRKTPPDEPKKKC